MKQPELGNKVLELRQNLGLTQAELAERSNVSLRTIQRVEALEVTPRNYTIKAILSCLGYDLEDGPPESVHDGEDRENGRATLTARASGYVRELFNLKTNAMKKLSVLSLFAALLFAGMFFAHTSLIAQNRKIKAATESLIGVWQQVIADPETGEVTYLSAYPENIQPRRHLCPHVGISRRLFFFHQRQRKMESHFGKYIHGICGADVRIDFHRPSGKTKVLSGQTP